MFAHLVEAPLDRIQKMIRDGEGRLELRLHQSTAKSVNVEDGGMLYGFPVVVVAATKPEGLFQA